MTDQAIYLATRGAVAELILNRPDKRNALSAAMWRALPELVGGAGVDAEVKALILRGASAEAFSPGPTSPSSTPSSSPACRSSRSARSSR
jgi:enoyl-CoA hydratase/carnithine racemase